MHHEYCPRCGLKLIPRKIGDEGLVPYCTACAMPLFDSFATCVICAVVNDDHQVALLRQPDLARTTRVCVSGYMKPGESAEDAAVREIGEELGLPIEGVTYMGSWPMTSKPMLMLGFMARTHGSAFTLSGEVENAAWFPYDKALGEIREDSIAWLLVKSVIDRETTAE